MSIATSLHQLGPIDRIPLGEARVYRVAGKDIAVFRCRSGNVFAATAECPHRGGPLADGLVGGDSVICPMHGFAFDLRTGEAAGRECERLATHRVSITSAGGLTLELE
jgi:nitrite reductase (NADH) small subunit